MCGLLLESKGQRPAGRCGPAVAPATVFWAAGRSALSRLTGPCHVALRLLAPGHAGWHAAAPTETWLVSARTRRRRRSLLRPRRARRGRGSGASAASSPARSPPGAAPRPCLCPHLPASRTHAALPASPSLVLPASLTPLDADCLLLPPGGRAGTMSPRAAAPGAVPRGHGARRRSLPAAEISGARRRAPGDAPRTAPSARSPALGAPAAAVPAGAAPVPSPEWVTVGEVAAGDPAE